MKKFTVIFTILLVAAFTAAMSKKPVEKPEPPKKEVPQKPKPEALEESEPSKTGKEAIAKIDSIAINSQCAKYGFGNRGRPQPGYIKGMARTFARAVCQPYREDVVFVSRARQLPESSFDNTDALSWYNSNFRALGMSNDSSGVDTLRHLYALLIGLGMRESSGKHCSGRDPGATNVDAETAEAGLFQTSYNSRRNKINGVSQDHPIKVRLFENYLHNQKGCMLDVFSEFRKGIRCKDGSDKNWGKGKGVAFQELTKSCPPFAIEYAAANLRTSRKHYGPINRKEAELRSECDSMLLEVQGIVDSDPSVCQNL